MIAKNYIDYPEALRFQREMFSNGYHNSPRIMRLMECMFDWRITAPQWFVDFRDRAKKLAKTIKKSIIELFTNQQKKGKK